MLFALVAFVVFLWLPNVANAVIYYGGASAATPSTVVCGPYASVSTAGTCNFNNFSGHANTYPNGTPVWKVSSITVCNGSTPGNGSIFYVTQNSGANNGTVVADGYNCNNTGWIWKQKNCTTSGEIPTGNWSTCMVGTPPTDPAVCAAQAGTYSADFDWYGTPPVLGSQTCSGGCQASIGISATASMYQSSGIYALLYGSDVCTGSEAALPSSTPSACAVGKCPGSVNGIDVCVPCTSSTGASVQSTYTPPAGSTAGSASEPANGSTVVTTDNTKVLNVDGTTTTTTTVKTTNYDSAGVPTTTSATTQKIEAPVTSDKENPVKDFCTKNPTAQMCQTNSWGGACGAFTCGGDAIQCAIAGEQHRRNCTLFDTPTTLSNLGNAAVAGTDAGTSTNPASAGNRETFGIGASLDQTRWLSASSCPAPVVFTIMNQSISFDFASMCNLLIMVGNAGVAVALIAAVFIVGVF